MTAADLLRGADILMASLSELRRETQEQETMAKANSDGAVGNNADAPTVVDRDAVRAVMNDISTAVTQPSTSNRSNISSSNSSLDDSVVIIGGAAQLDSIKPIGPNQDEDVIFVTEVRQPYRTLATIDLCDSFDSPKKTAAQASADDGSPSAKKPCSNNNNTTPQKSTVGTTKCPICLDMFTMDQILSTPCGHLYCGPCIQGVAKSRKKCPMCNRAFKQNQIHRIYMDPNV